MKKKLLIALSILYILSIFLLGCSNVQQGETIPETGGDPTLQESTGTTLPESTGTVTPPESTDATTPPESTGTTTPEASAGATTPQVGTCSHSWQAATCTNPKSCTLCGAKDGVALGHKEVVDPAVHATFSVAGRSEGKHCSVCGKVTKAQAEIPALGSDMVVGTDYFDREGQTTYRYSYSFTLYENDRFNLTTLKVGSDESYELTGENGKLNYLDNGIYELVFDSGRERMYGKFEGDQFQFCNKDGSEWEDQDQRPQGSTDTPITPRPGNSVYGYKDLANNTHGTSMQELYYRLYAACEAFVDNKKDVKATNGAYIIDKINLDYYVLTAEEAVAVWKVFYVENPRYYWLANTVKLEGGTLYVAIDKAYASASYRSSCDTAIDKLASACAQKLSSGMSQLEKAMAIHDFILGQMNYAFKSDGKTPQDAIWAHNMIGCAEKKSGVCESYAKTYQYLCRLNGLDCIVVTGFNGENHAWNMAKLDGSWYGVDCTFDETNKSAVSYSCFGMSKKRMNDEYTADKPSNSGINYLYKLPDLAERGIELVDLYKNGQKAGTYANIDAAFGAMTDAGADYEVHLFNYDRRGALLLSSGTVEHHITSTETPKVQSLTIRGDVYSSGDFSFTRMLWLDKKLTLRSELIIYDLQIEGKGALNLGSKKMSCLGKIVLVSVPVTGSMDSSSPSELHVGVAERIEFYEKVQVHTVSESADLNATFMFRNDATIVKCKAHLISLNDFLTEGITVQIVEFCPPEPAPEYADSAFYKIAIEGLANLKVDKITGPGEYVEVFLQFGKLEEFPTVTIGESNVPVELVLYGTVTHVSTDVNGNEVARWEDSVNAEDLKVPIATLLDENVMNTLTIYIIGDDDYGNEGVYVDRTDEYILNSKNQVVYKG